MKKSFELRRGSDEAGAVYTLTILQGQKVIKKIALTEADYTALRGELDTRGEG